MILMDKAAEQAVIAGVLRHGVDAYYDVADIVTPDTFTDGTNRILYSCLRHNIEKHDIAHVDIPSLYSAAQELGYGGMISSPDHSKYLQKLSDTPVYEKNVRKFGAKIRKLEVGRLLNNQLSEAQDRVQAISGDESISQILGIAEDSIFDFSSLLNDSDEDPVLLFDSLRDKLEYNAANQVDQIGISTGFGRYDASIGGGLRNGTVNLIAARTKVGKSMLGLSAGIHISTQLDIPVLCLDTEMMFEDYQTRLAANIASIEQDDIETGQFANEITARDRAYAMCDQYKGAPFYWKSIGGKPFEEQMSVMRRWLAKTVGLKSDGTANQCVIIYDYLKLMETSSLANMQEYQALGFMMTGLHNFAIRYKLPILAFLQTNREGIDKESTAVAAGSDRIVWLCSNFTIYKQKSDEEVAQDGAELGNRKLVPIAARHGRGLRQGEYINMAFRGEYAQITELETNLEHAEAQEPAGFDYDDDDVPF